MLDQLPPAFFLPTCAPRDFQARLSPEILRVTKLPKVWQRLAAMWLQPVGSAPRELVAVVSTDTPKWAHIMRDVHIQRDRDPGRARQDLPQTNT
ncbi:hypothetical protein UB46_29625 [Burkholderiaceae bacterium 16]|nr:hypothetical protein UB46_29625 [Burkholderiaceae bacterium 16]